MKLDSNLSHVELAWLTILPTMDSRQMLQTQFTVIIISRSARLDRWIEGAHTGFSSSGRFLFLLF
jgi:hypothetical protein